MCLILEEKLVLWTLLDTGLRVSELCGLTPQQRERLANPI
jgi:integrase/recombinase XerD